MLKKIIYYSSTYEFKGLKAFYAAWLREIELGKKTWLDNPTHIEADILTKYLRQTKTYQSSLKKKQAAKPSDDAEKEKV